MAAKFSAVAMPARPGRLMLCRKEPLRYTPWPAVRGNSEEEFLASLQLPHRKRGDGAVGADFSCNSQNLI
jgi:hypothetical protein